MVYGDAAIIRNRQAGFCAPCGTELAIQVEHRADTIDFTMACEPRAFVPGFHI